MDTIANRSPPKTHELFLRIVAAVRGSKRGLAIREIADSLDSSPALIAHCVALHIHLEKTGQEAIPLPPPDDYWLPDADDVITSATLEPLSNSVKRRRPLH